MTIEQIEDEILICEATEKEGHSRVRGLRDCRRYLLTLDAQKAEAEEQAVEQKGTLDQNG